MNEERGTRNKTAERGPRNKTAERGTRNEEDVQAVQPARAVMSVPDIAPITSGPSTRLRFLMWYFLVGGVLAIVAGVVTGGMRIFNDDASSTSPLASILSSALLMVTGGAWIITGRLLGRQRRAGAIMAIVSFALPIAEWFAGNQVSSGALAFHVAGLALLASVWSELRAD